MSYIPVYSTRINWENEPSIVSPINATNLNKMDYALKAHDDTLANWDITKANESDLLLALKEVSYDTDTGVFVFTWFNGTTTTIDLNIEKIPVSFSMDANGIITMTTEDGTTYTADVGALIKTYTFADSSVIDFTVTTDASGNKTVTADIVDGSIDGTKLVPNYLADCTAAKTGAENAKDDAEDSAEDAEAWAVGTRGGVPVPSTDPAYENNAEYWAHHTSSSLAGLSDVDLNNPLDGEVLKYNSITSKWENGQAAAGGGSTIEVSTSETPLYGQNVTITDGTTTLTQTFDNTGHATFSGVTMTGNLTIACLTASTSLNVPYFGNYTAVVSSFSASITVTYTGGTCTCVGNGESYTASGSPYTFTVHGAATYTITVTIDGVSKTDTVVITTDGQTETSTIEFGTINVTYENDFRGLSITCTQGGTTITKTAPSSGNTMVFYPPTTGSWVISGTVGGSPYSVTANVASLSTPVPVTLETIPDGSTKTPTDDVSIWLACAGITDKAYTTLAEVLEDSVTFNALLGDSNACAYMARSTTWASTLCADQYAMNLIGQYDTCCDALLSDTTWCSAICGSAYFESVLTDKVPVLSSATDIVYNNLINLVNAFDGNTSSTFGTSGEGHPANTYIGYHFSNPVEIRRVEYWTNGNAGNYVVNIEASDDGSTWDAVVSNISFSDPGSVAKIVLEDAITSSVSKPYWRIAYVSGTAYSYAGNEIQFYGRKSSGEKIHGANGESAYILDGGSPVTITDPSTFDAGTYTVYSTVAKDPSDLTADYSKTIRICPNTKEIVVRPDNALYWWGYNNGEIEIASAANGWTFNGTAVPATFQTNYINVKANSGNTQSGAGTRNTITGKTTASLIYTAGTGGYTRYLMGASKDCNVVPSGLVYNDLTNVGTTLTKVDLNIENKTGYVYVNCHNNSEVNIWALLAE